MDNCVRVVIVVSLLNIGFAVSPDWPSICPEIISRQQWGGKTPIAVDYAIIPVKFAIIHHTVTRECDSEESCSTIMKSIQDFHMNTMEFHDVGYNFFVGGDGKIYEGSGWHKVGAHTRGYNSRSLGLAFIGDFSNEKPPTKQIKAARDFLQCAAELGELDKDYKLFGARQVSATVTRRETVICRHCQDVAVAESVLFETIANDFICEFTLYILLILICAIIRTK
ncbi:hypothetical protein JTB14_030157 [Gonioctena quinquepunctata]|nr:hypothetical protein JTB14_030157 [Gonioctena quinquepunctata]